MDDFQKLLLFLNLKMYGLMNVITTSRILKKHRVTDGYTVVQKRIIENGIIVFQFQ